MLFLISVLILNVIVILFIVMNFSFVGAGLGFNLGINQ